jgi:hypothetical protein
VAGGGDAQLRWSPAPWPARPLAALRPPTPRALPPSRQATPGGDFAELAGAIQAYFNLTGVKKVDQEQVDAIFNAFMVGAFWGGVVEVGAGASQRPAACKPRLGFDARAQAVPAPGPHAAGARPCLPLSSAEGVHHRRPPLLL